MSCEEHLNWNLVDIAAVDGDVVGSGFGLSGVVGWVVDIIAVVVDVVDGLVVPLSNPIHQKKRMKRNQNAGDSVGDWKER